MDYRICTAELELTNVSFPRSFEVTLGFIGGVERRYSFEKKGDEYRILFEFEAALFPDIQRAIEIFSPLGDIITYLAKTRLDYRFTLIRKESGAHYLIRPELHHDYVMRTKLTDETIERAQSILLKLYSKPTLRSDEIQEYYLFENALRWYRKSLEGDRVDRFIFLWIVFNMLYNEVWFRNHSDGDRGSETDRMKYLIEADKERSGLINERDCKTLVAGNYWLARSMPDYGMYASNSEFSQDPSKEQVERWHDKYIKETGDLEKYLFNRMGLEFGKYFVLKDWQNALKEALLAVYGDRCLIFHEGHFPIPTQDLDDPHEARVALLDNVVHIVLDKLL